MAVFKKFLLLALCSFSLSLHPGGETHLLSYAKGTLPTSGILKKVKGFVYVDLDDDYIHSLIAFLQDEGFQEPPYFGGDDLIGAHISVIYQEETKKYSLNDIEECGQKIDFVLKECRIVHPLRWQEIDEVFFIVVEAPQLDRIREKYGLPKPEFNYHITIGVRPKLLQEGSQPFVKI